MAEGKYIHFDSLEKLEETKEILRLIVGKQKNNKNYQITDEDFVKALKEKNLIPNFGDIDNDSTGDTITNIFFDSSTSTLSIITDTGRYDTQLKRSFKVQNITERDQLLVNGEVEIGDIVFVIDEDKSYQLKSGNIWQEIGSGSASFNGNRTITRSGIPNINVGGNTIEEFANNFFFPAEEPVITEPSVSMNITGSLTREVGTVITETISMSLNPGSIKGNLVNGNWDPNASQGNRSGDADYFRIDGTEIPTHPVNSAQKQVTKTISYGSNSFLGTVGIFSGIHPINSSGNLSSQYSAYPYTTSSKSVNVQGRYRIFYGATPIIPTVGVEGRMLPQNRFETDNNIFILNTWDQHGIYCLLVPQSKNLVEAIDLDAIGQPMDYILTDPNFQMVDGSGNAIVEPYKLYVCTQTIPNQDNHRHQITIQ